MKNNGDVVKFLKSKDYEMVNNNLGSGAFGKTVLLRDPYIDELFVAKKYEPYYDYLKEEFYDSFIKEIKLLHKLNHRNIVRVYNYYPFDSVYTGYIIMEYIDGERIDEYLDDYFIFGDGTDPDQLFIQLIDGFDYIEQQGIVHRDIREGNILVTKEGLAKIIDFGLGKTFSPIDVNADSMATIIDRSGLDRLPEECFEGKYDSQTDMFYLAELYNRLLVNTKNDAVFSYMPILHRMMEIKRENRYSSFAEVKEAINSKDFNTIEIGEEDKEIYQAFSNSILYSMDCFIDEKSFVSNVNEFVERIRLLIKKNCFEYCITKCSDIIKTVVTSNFKYYPRQDNQISCIVITDFDKWFSSLSSDSQQLVLNNIIAKISSSVKIEYTEPDLPF